MTLRPLGRRVLLICLALAGLALLAATGGALWVWHRMAASLPPLDGRFALAGLGAPVTVARDALGTPTLTGASRIDVARATGWIHAQDRFFQMDLLRRRGGGELSELFGAAALGADKEARLHDFRALAGAVLAAARPDQRALLQAYSEGVNAGLRALPALPWEYAVLRLRPRPWAPADTILIIYAMTLDLQDTNGRFVRNLAEVRDEIGPASLAFFAPELGPDDGALDNSTGALPPPPALELRPATAARARARPAAVEPPGSNNFAVAGRFTATGGALVADDMHLHLSVPTIWYRLALRWPGHQVTGVSLPGTPLVVAGSNGSIAWGFTNSYAGTGDVVRIDPSLSPDLYHGPGGALKAYGHRTELIAVRGAAPVKYDVTTTVWGPVVATEPDNHQLVYHWTGDDPAATNTDLGDLEEAHTVRAALDVAHRLGIPAQNFVVGDARGSIGWTVAGKLPRRTGYDGRLPVSYVFGDRGWDRFLGAAEVPEVVDPAAGRLWTANNRTVGGAALAKLGDSGYIGSARAAQIRSDLDALLATGRKLAPADLLGVQLDDRGLLLHRWRDLLVRTLEAAPARSGRPALLAAVRLWDGRAGTGSRGYDIIRAFRLEAAHRILAPIFAACTDRDADFSWGRFNWEEPVDRLLRERPSGCLDPAYATWDDLLRAAADAVAADYAGHHRDPRTVTWGELNRARIEHPFAALLPGWARGLLALPADPLAGDTNMPRIQGPAYGASERFAVTPGHEDQGIMHLPGGASGNPLSPYFAAGHEAWVHGEPTPFLPGPSQHTLTLAP